MIIEDRLIQQLSHGVSNSDLIAVDVVLVRYRFSIGHRTEQCKPSFYPYNEMRLSTEPDFASICPSGCFGSITMEWQIQLPW